MGKLSTVSGEDKTGGLAKYVIYNLYMKTRREKGPLSKKSRNGVINWPKMTRSRFICRFVFEFLTFTDVVENRD